MPASSTAHDRMQTCWRGLPLLLLLIAMLNLLILFLLLLFHFCHDRVTLDVDVEIRRGREEYFFAIIKSPRHPHCRQFRREWPLSADRDADMDIAFTLVVHKDVGQIARLLRMIYRENNYYCLHPDARSTPSFVDALSGLAACLGANVQVVPPDRRIAVTWGDESVLRPQLVCGEQALRRHSTWQYLVNLVGQDFPLRTNRELVAALKALNHSNLVEGFSISRYKNWVRNIKLPMEATWYKGSIYGAFRRDFLQEAILGGKIEPIRRLMLRHDSVEHADELFFPTLAFNPQLRLPAACLRAPLPASETGMGFLGKFVIWRQPYVTCPTKYVRNVCILGKSLVTQLKLAPHIAANKFHADYEPEAYDEMEKWYLEKVKREVATGSYSREHFDPTPYALLSCSRDHI